MELSALQRAILAQRVNITQHADEEMEADRLVFSDVAHAAVNGEVIEDYPDDKPFPSALLLGPTRDGSWIHGVWAYSDEQDLAFLITVYRPDPDRWTDLRIRNKRHE